jgi:hypothetical protein
MEESKEQLCNRFLTLWNEAQTIGWSLCTELYTLNDHATLITTVIPPVHFECRNWGARLEQFIIDGSKVHVPNWFFINKVMTAGTR